MRNGSGSSRVTRHVAAFEESGILPYADELGPSCQLRLPCVQSKPSGIRPMGVVSERDVP